MVFLTGIVLCGTCGGYVMGVRGGATRRVVWAMRLFLLGAVLVLAYILCVLVGIWSL